MSTRRLAAVFPILFATLFLAACEIRIERVATPEVTPEDEAAYARWPELPVDYCIDFSRRGFVDNERLAAKVERAFQAWGVEYVNRGECEETPQDGNNVNQIGWGIVEGFGGGHAGVFEAGVTRMRVASAPRRNGDQPARLIEANIIIDPEPPHQFRTAECLYTTVLHEVGHFLGLGHINPPAVMSPVQTGCPQELTENDRRALHELYNGPR